MINQKFLIPLCLVIIVIVVALFILLDKKSNDTDLSSLDKIIFNSSEEEILGMLRRLDKFLSNIEDKNNNVNSLSINFTEPIRLKDFITKLYEVRKTTDEDGNIIYILDVETKIKDKNGVRRLCTFSDNNIYISLTDSDIDYSSIGDEKLESNEDGSISYTFGADFYKNFISSLNEQLNDVWEKSEKFEAVDYNLVFKNF